MVLYDYERAGAAGEGEVGGKGEVGSIETKGSVTRLIQELRSDDPGVRDVAARLIWERYFRALLDLARRQLDRRVRRREDEEDVLQSMYDSFCRRQRRGDFDLAGRDQLWSLLVQITLCKARNVANKHRSGKRDVARELNLADDPSGIAGWSLELMDASGPTPSEAAVLNEALEQRLRVLKEPDLPGSLSASWRGGPTARSPLNSAARSGRSRRKLELKRGLGGRPALEVEKVRREPKREWDIQG